MARRCGDPGGIGIISRSLKFSSNAQSNHANEYFIGVGREGVKPLPVNVFLLFYRCRVSTKRENIQLFPG
jgi:hypothetical protein